MEGIACKTLSGVRLRGGPYFPRIQLKNEEGYWMRRKWNRFVAGLLSIVLLVTMLPMEVLAAGNGGRAEQPSQTMPFQDVKSSVWGAKAVDEV